MDNLSSHVTGKNILVTGATRGLGLFLATELARAGATVLAHGRDEKSLTAVVNRLRADGGSAKPYLADLSDLDQVRELADRVSADNSRLDVLVHNAVVGGGADPKRRETSVQGHELRFAVNHLAPLLLTRRLTPLLTASAPARIVNVASIGQSEIPLDDVMFTRDYDGITAYCRSKLAMIMSTFDLAAELDGSGVTANVLHPAHLMDTTAVRESNLIPETTVEHGGRPTLRLIADPALTTVSGKYFDRFDEKPAHPQAYDPEARKRLSEICEELIA